MFDYQIINVEPNDILFIDFNTDKFDLEVANIVFEQIQNALPSNTIIPNPSGIVNGVKIFRQNKVIEKGDYINGNIY